MRISEQEVSAKIGGYELEVLRLPDGSIPREACLQVSVPLLAALWKSIREFEPDYIFCPPLPVSNLVGVHNDHITIADAVRRVAYMINVPHAFTPEYPELDLPAKQVKVPAIFTVHDGYMAGANSYDLAVNIEPSFEQVAQMSYCHQSQISEWLPWVGRHAFSAPQSFEAWKNQLQERFQKRNRDLGLDKNPLAEVFTLTAWGEIPSLEKLLNDFPNVIRLLDNFSTLRQKMASWS